MKNFRRLQWLNKSERLLRKYRYVLLISYSLFVGVICFLPQHTISSAETPGIERLGHLVFLLTPFNSIVHFGEISNFKHLIWIIGQNVINIFLLLPAVFLLVDMFPTLRSAKKVIVLSFLLSLFIECTQLFLDALIDANRVFEIDDLWTNTLGGYLAYLLYKKWKKM